MKDKPTGGKAKSAYALVTSRYISCPQNILMVALMGIQAYDLQKSVGCMCTHLDQPIPVSLGHQY